MSCQRHLAVLIGVSLAVALSPADLAGPGSTSPPGPVAAARIVLDPQTGQPVVPVMGEALPLMLSRSSRGLVKRPHPLGGWSVDLQGRFMSLSLARVDEDGSVLQTCVTSEAEAEAFVGGRAPRRGAVR